MEQDTLTQRREVCDHPEEDCIESNADVMGMFTIYCKKCNTTFNRYDYDEIRSNRKTYGDDYAWLFTPDWDIQIVDINRFKNGVLDEISIKSIEDMLNGKVMESDRVW
jgi:hypothetical protein